MWKGGLLVSNLLFYINQTLYSYSHTLNDEIHKELGLSRPTYIAAIINNMQFIFK